MQGEERKIVNPDFINVFKAFGWAGGLETSYFMQVNWSIGASGHAKREEEIFRSKWKWVSRDAAATAAKWAPSGLPNCCAFIRNLCRILG